MSGKASSFLVQPSQIDGPVNVLRNWKHLIFSNFTNIRHLGVFGSSFPQPPALEPRPHKTFNQLNLLLGNVQPLWSCAHYFQSFTGYLKPFCFTVTGTCLKKLPYFSRCFVDFILCSTGKYMFKVNNKKIDQYALVQV